MLAIIQRFGILLSIILVSGCSSTHFINRTVYEGLFTFYGDRHQDSMFLKDGTADCTNRPNFDYQDYVWQKERFINNTMPEFDYSIVDN